MLKIFLVEVLGKYIKRLQIECTNNSKALGKLEQEALRQDRDLESANLEEAARYKKMLVISKPHLSISL